MADQFILTEASAKVLQRLLDDYKRMRRNTLGSTQEEELPTTPEVYVARTPGGGIPGMRGDWDTGTGTLPTGTASAHEGNTPGSADCNIYRTYYTSTTPNLMAMGFTRKILNLSFNAVPGNSWVLVHRDKYGDWYTKDELGGGTTNITGTVTVQGYNGSPSYTNTTILRFYGSTDPSQSPFAISTFATNSVAVVLEAATASQCGYVTTSEQQFSGQKTVLGTGTLSVNLAHGDATTGLGCHRAGKALYGANTYSWTTYFVDGSTTKTGHSHLQINTSSTWVESSICYNATINSSTFKIGMHSETIGLPSSTQTCYFFTYDNLNQQQVTGKSGKITPGSEFIGGIITTLASKPTITGSRAGNAALASLLTALSNAGFITDSSSA